MPGINGARAGVQALALDSNGGLLVSLVRRGLWTFADGVWKQDSRLQNLQDPTPISMLRDTRGNTWLGLTNNRVGVLKADRLALLPPAANLQIGNTLSMLDVGGRLRFRVIAANEDGVWNHQGAALTFHIQPRFWQTLWFRSLCMALLLSAGVVMYRWRIASVKRHAERSAAARIEATLQERGRIAPSLYDNLLQAVQALLLRFQTLQSRLPQEPELQARLEKVLVYAEELVTSTRDEVVGLRSDRLPDDLFVALREAVAASAPAAEGLLAFSEVGQRKPLADDTARELFYVLREAVWNSARHAQPSRIAVELRYGEDALTASVIDDGIGIRATGTGAIPGHWGIVGMRERMQRLGGKIEITSPAQGTTVQLTIPAALAYA